MALTFTDKMGGKHLAMGGRSWRFYEVTHDGSETSMAASDFGLTEVEFAMAGPHTIVLSAASTVGIDLTTSSGKSLAMTAMSSGAVTSLLLIGW